MTDEVFIQAVVRAIKKIHDSHISAQQCYSEGQLSHAERGQPDKTVETIESKEDRAWSSLYKFYAYGQIKLHPDTANQFSEICGKSDENLRVHFWIPEFDDKAA